MKKRVAASKKFLAQYRKDGDDYLERIITTDETWIFLFDPEINQGTIPVMEDKRHSTSKEGATGEVHRRTDVHLLHGQGGDDITACSTHKHHCERRVLFKGKTY